MNLFLAQASNPAKAAPIPDQTGEIDVSSASVLERVDNLIDGFLRLLPNIAIGVVVFILFLFIGKIIRSAIRKSMGHGSKKNLGIVLARLAGWGAMFAGFLVAMTIIAPSVKPADLLATLGIGGVAIGFAFKDILQNFLAGLLLLIRQPFEIGDQIECDGHEGTVKEIETRATILRTYDGKRVVIPNGQIYTSAIVVNTANDVRRTDYDVGIGYGDDIDKACEVMLEAMRNVEGVVTDPAPQVIAMELDGSSVNLRARWWTDPRKAGLMKARHDVIRGIKKALDDANIDMPYPTRVILFHDQTEKTDGDRTQQREGWPAGENPPESARISESLSGSSESESANGHKNGASSRAQEDSTNSTTHPKEQNENQGITSAEMSR